MRLASILLVLCALLVGLTGFAQADCEVCWPDGYCGFCPDQDCGDFIPDDTGAVCHPCEFSVANDYLLHGAKAEVYVVTGGKQIPFLSDDFVAYVAKLKATYPRRAWKDPATRMKIAKQIDAYRARHNHGIGPVSKARIDKFMRKTGLSFRKGNRHQNQGR